MPFQSWGPCFAPGWGWWDSDLDICVVLPGETSALDDVPSHGLERVGRCTFLIWDKVQLWSALPKGCSWGLQFPVCCCTIHSFGPQSSYPPCLGVHHARPCSSFESSERHCPYLLWQGVFKAICATPGLTDAQDVPSTAGQKADFISHEKMSRFKCFYCEGGRKGQTYFFLLKWCPREICSALILLSFLFSLFSSPLNKVNITLNNTIKFLVRHNLGFGYRGYTGIFDVLLMVKHMEVVKNIFLCWWSAAFLKKKNKKIPTQTQNPFFQASVLKPFLTWTLAMEVSPSLCRSCLAVELEQNMRGMLSLPWFN